MFFNKNNKEKKNEKENEKPKIKMILPLYLNQRFIYDILAVKNDGFTEFFEIKDKDQKNMEMKGKIDGSFGTNNKFSLIQANMNTSLNSEMMNNRNNEKSYRWNSINFKSCRTWIFRIYNIWSSKRCLGKKIIE